MKVNKVIILSLLCGMSFDVAAGLTPSEEAIRQKIENDINAADGLQEKIQKQVNNAPSPVQEIWKQAQAFVGFDGHPDEAGYDDFCQFLKNYPPGTISHQLQHNLALYFRAKARMYDIYKFSNWAYTKGGQPAVLDWLKKAALNRRYSLYLNGGFRKNLISQSVLADTLQVLNKKVLSDLGQTPEQGYEVALNVVTQSNTIASKQGFAAAISYIEQNESSLSPQLFKDLKQLITVTFSGL